MDRDEDFNFNNDGGSPNRFGRDFNDSVPYYRNQGFTQDDDRDDYNQQKQQYVSSGNQLPVRDLGKPDYTFFNLMVSGHIQSGTINDHDGISCFFQFVNGVDWHCVEVSIKIY